MRKFLFLVCIALTLLLTSRSLYANGLSINWKAFVGHGKIVDFDSNNNICDISFSFEQDDITKEVQNNKQVQGEAQNSPNSTTEIKGQTQNVSNQLLLTVVVLLVIVSVLLYVQNSKRKSINHKLNNKNAQLKKANGRLNELNEEIFRQNESINLQNVNLEKLDELKNKLFSIISHDVRSPLKSIEGVLGLLKSDSLSKSEINEIALKLSENVSSISGFLDNLLKWANSQMTNLSTNVESLNMAELVQININLVKLRAEEKQIVLTNNVKELIFCKADKEMINLIVRNLLTNAIKFSNIGGEINVGINVENEGATIWVKDAGVGMTKEVYDQLFTLNRYTTVGTNNEKGTGLGLVMCKDFAEKNNGKIWAESEVGSGSTFFFTLPLEIENVSLTSVS